MVHPDPSKMAHCGHFQTVYSRRRVHMRRCASGITQVKKDYLDILWSGHCHKSDGTLISEHLIGESSYRSVRTRWEHVSSSASTTHNYHLQGRLEPRHTPNAFYSSNAVVCNEHALNDARAAAFFNEVRHRRKQSPDDNHGCGLFLNSW